MGNRLILGCLQSLEAIFVPNKLLEFGLSNAEALSTYGVLTGMALPFIFFRQLSPIPPCGRSAAHCLKHRRPAMREKLNARLPWRSVTACIWGILCIGIFTLFGDGLGISVYHNKDAGTFITILAWLCPFMYLSTTMGSILNGLGKTSTIFLHNAISMLITLAVVVFCIPMYGIHAYLAGLLFSELVLAALHIHTLAGQVPVRLNAGHNDCKTNAVPSGRHRYPLSLRRRRWKRSGRPCLRNFCLLLWKALILCVLYGGLSASA